MADLTFHHGPMGAGKSLHALVAAHQQTRRGRNVLVCVKHPRTAGEVASRVGIAMPAVELTDTTELFALLAQAHLSRRLAAVVVDEAQFLTPAQVDAIARFVDHHDVAVDCYGLLTDFRGQLFPGSARLVELADQLMSISPGPACWCGARATHTIRLIDGRPVRDGAVVVVGDIDDADVSYDAVCRPHHRAGQVGPPSGQAAAAA